MATCAPIAVAMALSANPASASSGPIPVLPIASAPPPSANTQWVNVAPGPTQGSVTVSGSRAYAEWQSFNVSAGATFTVNGQVGKDWILVNKVVGASGNAITPSTLAGTITANGQVWVLNQAGIAVSNTGLFNVGGMLLSTASNFGKAAYLSGGLAINFTGAATAIQVNGAVDASGGIVTFLAPVITIKGQVHETSPGVSQVVAVAAQDVSLVFTDNGARLALDGVTINTGSDVNQTPGGITQGAGSQIIAGRIILAAAGANLTSSIIVNGALAATPGAGGWSGHRADRWQSYCGRAERRARPIGGGRGVERRDDIVHRRRHHPRHPAYQHALQRGRKSGRGAGRLSVRTGLRGRSYRDARQRHRRCRHLRAGRDLADQRQRRRDFRTRHRAGFHWFPPRSEP